MSAFALENDVIYPPILLTNAGLMCFGTCTNGLTGHHWDVTKQDSGSTVMTSTKISAMRTAMIPTLGFAAVCWVIIVHQMSGMGVGVATLLGSFISFIVMWVLMMAATMLPGITPIVLKHAHASYHVLTVLLFIGSYLVVWISNLYIVSTA